MSIDGEGQTGDTSYGELPSRRPRVVAIPLRPIKRVFQNLPRGLRWPQNFRCRVGFEIQSKCLAVFCDNLRMGGRRCKSVAALLPTIGRIFLTTSVCCQECHCWLAQQCCPRFGWSQELGATSSLHQRIPHGGCQCWLAQQCCEICVKKGFYRGLTGGMANNGLGQGHNSVYRSKDIW